MDYKDLANDIIKEIGVLKMYLMSLIVQQGYGLT